MAKGRKFFRLRFFSLKLSRSGTGGEGGVGTTKLYTHLKNQAIHPLEKIWSYTLLVDL